MNPNYTTLNKDIGLVQRSNNGWDLWFENGDTVKADDSHSLQTGIILACLTSWNYMNRYGNPTYETFGNRAYELLKENKGSMVAYKIQQYFIECLKRMRRVYEIVYLEVSETPTEPNKYFVEFEVISINNQLVNGSFYVTTDTSKSTSYIEYTTYMPYASNENPLTIDLYLKNEYGGGLEGEILYVYIQKGDGEYEFMGVVGKTDENGYIRITYEPTENNENNTIYFDFQGNTTYNPSTSQRTSFKTELYEYYITFTNSNIINNNILTSNDYADLKLKLRKKSLLDEKCYDVENTTITIIGDGLGEYPNKTTFYDAMTDENGEATIRTKIEEDTLFTTSYNNSTSYVNVTILKQTPTITLTTNKTQMLMGEILELRAIVKDENNNYLKDFEVIFKDGEEIIGSATTNENGVAILSTNSLLAKEYQITANSNNTNFYDQSESDIVTVTIDKHIPTIEVSVEESTIVVGNDIMLTALVTENESRLFNLTVSFKDEENNELGTALCSEGVATLLINGLDVGEHTITATVMENDYYETASDTVTFTVIDHHYDLTLNVNRTSSIIQDKHSINYTFEVSPVITDNGLSVNTLDLTDNNIIISCNETGDEWVVEEYIQDVTKHTISYMALGDKTLTFNATWNELEATTEVSTPIWEDSCTVDSTSIYPIMRFDESAEYTQVVSNEYCKNNWTKLLGLCEISNSSISINEESGESVLYYTASEPIKVSIIPTVNQWQYAVGVSCGIIKSYDGVNINDDSEIYQFAEQLEEIGYVTQFDAILEKDDTLVVRLFSEANIIHYQVSTIEYPASSFTHINSEQAYYLNAEDTRDSIIGRYIINKKYTNKKVSCKVKFNSSDSSNQFLLGVFGSEDNVDYWDMLRLKGNGVAEYYKKKTNQQSIVWSENTNISENEWITIELTLLSDKVIVKLYDENSEIITTTTQTYTPYKEEVDKRQIFFGINGENVDGIYIKDINIEPYNILYKSSLTSDDSMWMNTGDCIVEYTNDGCQVTIQNTLSEYKLNIPIPEKYSCEFDIISCNSPYIQFVVGNIGISSTFKNPRRSTVDVKSGLSSETYSMDVSNLPIHIKVDCDDPNGTGDVYINGDYVGTLETAYRLIGFMGDRGTMTVKNIIVRILD